MSSNPVPAARRLPTVGTRVPIVGCQDQRTTEHKLLGGPRPVPFPQMEMYAARYWGRW
jgi:hypothetical protein